MRFLNNLQKLEDHNKNRRIRRLSRQKCLVSILVDTAVKIANRVIFAVDHPLGGEQALQSDRTSRMNFAGRNTDLGSQTEPVAIGESAAAIVENASTVHSALEVLGARTWKIEKCS